MSLNRKTPQRKRPRPPANKLHPFLRRIVITTLVLACLSACVAGVAIYFLSRDLPSLDTLEKFEPFQVTHLISRDGVLLRDLYTDEKRVLVPLSQMSHHLIDAVIATEDKRFHSHWGVDVYGIARAAVVNILAFRYKQGFSTITMQLARQLYLHRRKELIRKLKEILTAIQIERTYAKDEILEMFLNQSYFGNRAYGVFSAAQNYFGKNVSDLSLAESALLIAQLKAPAIYSPIDHHDRALTRRNLVLGNMYDEGFIDRAAYEQAIDEPIQLKSDDNTDFVGLDYYFTEHVRLELERRQEEIGYDLQRDGLTVVTTLDARLQDIAEEAYLEHLQSIQPSVTRNIRRKGLMGAARAAGFDTTVQGSFIALDPAKGHILAMIGGRDFHRYKFNRATQAVRQPGSSFKPFVWTAAIDNGATPVTQLLNQKVVIYNPDGTRWTPSNYEGELGGPTTLREGLRKSYNLISVRIIQELVPAQVVINYAHRMGISTELDPYDALALGSSGVILLDEVSAYSVFPNKGIRVEPVSILRIEDRFGNVIYENVPQKKEVLSMETAYLMTDMLQTVVRAGTGATSRSVYGFLHPAGGKTGTTNEWTDAWFVGFTKQIAAGVWVGLDQPTLSLGPGLTGARAALPIWARFMKGAHDVLNLPPAEFERPPGVVEVQICDDTKKIAGPYCPNKTIEVFNRKYQPTEMCPMHSGVSTR